jgi:beta-N-acetylhexosaminidase
MSTSLLRRTTAQLFMVGIPGPTLDPDTAAFLADRPPGGVILFKRNVRTARQVRALVDALHATGSGVRPIVSIDHEGGRVHRLPRPFTHFPPAASWTDPKTAEAVGLAMGRELAAVGIDLDFAPVLDVWSNPENRVIGDRAFGTTPAPVARAALAQARGLARGGVLTCGKHFPGHGDTLADSHFELPTVAKSRRALEAMEIAPFRRAIAARIPSLMTAHVVYPALDPRRPATLSPLICRNLLRRRLGFRGVLFSDDLEMQAVAGRAEPGAIAVGALKAGCDMLLVCQSLAVAAKAMDGVEQAIARGRLSADEVATALARIQAFRRRLPARRTPGRLAWPAHARLARRIARDAAET